MGLLYELRKTVSIIIRKLFNIFLVLFVYYVQFRFFIGFLCELT